VIRAKIVLLAGDGEFNVGIAERLGVHVATVSFWRTRWFVRGLTGLEDHKRTGRPRSFAPEVVAEVKAMACERPAHREVVVAVELGGAGRAGGL
jgi:transposase